MSCITSEISTEFYQAFAFTIINLQNKILTDKMIFTLGQKYES